MELPTADELAAKALKSLTPAELVAMLAELITDIAKAQRLAEACLAYHAAIKQCANDPAKMASFCTATGESLDQLYKAWLTLATELAEETGLQ